MIETESVQAIIEELKQGIPLKKIGSSEDVSKLVLFLASDDSNYSTGSEFTIDGGLKAQN